MGCVQTRANDLFVIDATVKINGTYYCEVLWTQKQPLVMREICGEFFIFQQGNELTEVLGCIT